MRTDTQKFTRTCMNIFWMLVSSVPIRHALALIIITYYPYPYAYPLRTANAGNGGVFVVRDVVLLWSEQSFELTFKRVRVSPDQRHLCDHIIFDGIAAKTSVRHIC